jgi:F-type H+-transporting ATPase subunit epsilon
MAENTFKVSIITPERSFYEGEATMVEFNTACGEIGVLSKHIPLTTVIAPGICTITEPEGEKRAAVHAGLAEILPDRVTLLAEIAEWPDEIDVERAKSAEDRARERLATKDANLDVLRAELALKKALVRQNILD